jgi:hypothetical protein
MKNLLDNRTIVLLIFIERCKELALPSPGGRDEREGVFSY